MAVINHNPFTMYGDDLCRIVRRNGDGTFLVRSLRTGRERNIAAERVIAPGTHESY